VGLHGLHFLRFTPLQFTDNQMIILFYHQKVGLQCKP